MDNNNIMQLMMQMMQNQNQLLAMMMQNQMQQGQQTQVPTTQTPTITSNDSSEIAALRAELNQIKTELAAERQTHEATKKALEYERQSNQKQLKELSDLKKTIGIAEAYLGQRIEDVAETAENLGGDDFYAKKKDEWDEKGLTNQEKHDKIKEFRDFFNSDEKEDDIFGEMIEF